MSPLKGTTAGSPAKHRIRPCFMATVKRIRGKRKDCRKSTTDENGRSSCRKSVERYAREFLLLARWYFQLNGIKISGQFIARYRSVYRNRFSSPLLRIFFVNPPWLFVKYRIIEDRFDYSSVHRGRSAKKDKRTRSDRLLFAFFCHASSSRTSVYFRRSVRDFFCTRNLGHSEKSRFKTRYSVLYCERRCVISLCKYSRKRVLNVNSSVAGFSAGFPCRLVVLRTVID